jgi:23S rRNA pseudouridine2605 synthase
MSFAPFYAYQIQKNQGDFSILKVAIGEGQNRELRRFFAHFGAEVVDLKRLSFGGIDLNNLPTGKVRFLERNEYTSLREFLDAVEKAEKTQQKTEKKFPRTERTSERKPEKKNKEKAKPKTKPATDSFATNKYNPDKKFTQRDRKK